MIEVEESILVSLPREEVFAFAAQPENMPLWNHAIQESTVVGKLEAGARVVQSVDILGRSFEAVFEVTCYEPYRRVVYTSTSGPVEIEGAMTFRSEKGKTRVRWTVSGDSRGFLRVAEGVLLGLGRPEMRTCLENLKSVLEDGEPVEPPRPSMRRKLPLRPLAVISSGTKILGGLGSILTNKS